VHSGWGDNQYGQIGVNSLSRTVKEPTRVQSLPPISKLAAGTSHVLALSTEGEVFTWGATALGQTGQKDDSASGAPACFAFSWELCVCKDTDTRPMHSVALSFFTLVV
jgi:alpha-tubulin suppressor-like RCC1 family protein